MSLLFPGKENHLFAFADVILALNLPKVLTYGVPYDMQELLQPGMRVEVALGKNKFHAGIVARLHNEKPESFAVKPIRKILDDAPVIFETQLRFWKWIAHYYAAAPGEVMQAALPAHLKLSGETKLIWAPHADEQNYEWTDEAFLAAEALSIRKEISIPELRQIVGQKYFEAVLNELLEAEVIIIDDALTQTYKSKKEKIISLDEIYQDEKALHKLFDELSRAPKQLDMLMAYMELSVKNVFVKLEDLLDRTNANTAQLKALTDKGIFTVTEKDISRLMTVAAEKDKELILTEAQQNSLEKIKEGWNEKEVALLEGVTGSGKTLIYVQLIKETLAAGKQAIFLLPEIALTTQLVSRLYAYFGEDMGVYHSRFSNNERVEIWEKVRSGKYKIVVGPRSVLWLPFKDIGLIVVDEEHDGSYKQKDPAPRFHARDAAIYLASLFKAKTLLGSATPSIESLFNAQQGKYAYTLLNERYLGVGMPVIELIDARSLESTRAQGVKLLTPELQQAIAQSLVDNKQVILFQNRRGYAPFQLCTMCGWVPQCKNCAVSLTYHKSSDKMHCHYCGSKWAVIHTCPSCGSNKLRSKTFGTERIEEEVQMLFPKARVARMDVDSTRGKQSLQILFDKLEKQKIDILVGTQMVVKGIDLAHVALVGIISSDGLLSYPDFRVNERAFQLMEQVSGRAGRTDGSGKVLIQAHNMEHPVLKWVKAHDVRSYYAHEIQFRKHFGYPPFIRLIKIIFKHKEEAKAMEAASQIATGLKTCKGIDVQGPAPALVSRVRNQYIQEVWVKCPRDIKLIDSIKALMKEQREWVCSLKGFFSLQVIIDIDPVY